MLTITPTIVAAFRVDFSGFADDVVWPDAVVTRSLQLADAETGSTRWGNYTDLSIKQRGMFNFAAHNLTFKKLNETATANGGAPASTAQVQSKTVADESITYAVNAQGQPASDAALNSTSYGQEFIRLRRRVGSGGSSSNALVA